MSLGLFVSKDGKVTEAIGPQPKEALLFAPSRKNSTQILREQREAIKRNSMYIRERFAKATER